MERTQEELQQIYDDLMVFKEKLNWLSSFGQLLPVPLNGKTWEEEKAEYYDRAINAFDNLTNEVVSCEMKTFCQESKILAEQYRSRQGFWNHVGFYYPDFSENTLGEYGSIKLGDFADMVKQVINGNATDATKKLVNETLDSIGTSACTPRAHLDVDLTRSNQALPNVRPDSQGVYKG